MSFPKENEQDFEYFFVYFLNNIKQFSIVVHEQDVEYFSYLEFMILSQIGQQFGSKCRRKHIQHSIHIFLRHLLLLVQSIIHRSIESDPIYMISSSSFRTFIVKDRLLPRRLILDHW